MEKQYRQCYMIRAFEKRVEKEFEKGLMRGTTHGCVGQEVIPVLAMNYVEKETDIVTGTHRCHGQVLAYTNDPFRLACEMMGKSDGFNQGVGGSQHIKYEGYITNGVTGGMAAVGVGIAFSLKTKNGIVLSFLGDGGFQEGYVQETLNMAQTYQVPILYILENNRYAMSTCTQDCTSGTAESRVKAIEMEYELADARDLDDLNEKLKRAFEFVRQKKMPFFLEVATFRLCGHSKSDDLSYMTEEERDQNLKDDPLCDLRKKLGREKAAAIEVAVDRQINDIFEEVNCSGEMDFERYMEAKNENRIT